MQLTAPKIVLGLGAAAAAAATAGTLSSGLGAAGRGEQVTFARTQGLTVSAGVVGLGTGGLVAAFGAPRTGAAVGAAGLMVAAGAALGTGIAQAMQGSQQLRS